MLLHVWGDMVESQLVNRGGEDLLVAAIEVHAVEKLHRDLIVLCGVGKKGLCLLIKERGAILKLSDLDLL